MPAHPLAAWQREDAARLLLLVTAWQADRRARGLPYSQAWACEQMQFGQSALSQYLNGKIPLNLAAAAKISRLVEVAIEEFSPTIAATMREFAIASATGIPMDLALRVEASAPGATLDAGEWRLVLLYRGLPKEGKDLLTAVASQLRPGPSGGQ